MPEIVTLLLSWNLAIKFKKDESEAIHNTAKQLVNTAERKEIKDIIDVLALESTSANRRIEILKTLEQVLRNQK